MTTADPVNDGRVWCERCGIRHKAGEHFPEEPVVDDLDDQPSSLDDDEWTNREGMPEFNGSFR